MTALALYVFTTLTASAGLLGHTPVLGRAACWVGRWAANRGRRGSRITETPERPPQERTRPSWADTQPIDYEEAA